MMKRMLGIITANFSGDELGSLTAERPVASLPVAGRYRLVDFPLSNMRNSGITTVGLITPYLYRSLMDHVEEGKAWQLSRKTGGLFVLPGSVYGLKGETDKFLLRDFIQNRAILDRSSSDVVVVTTSDWVYNIDFRDVLEQHNRTGADVTMLYKKDFRANAPGSQFLRLKDDGEVTAITGTGSDCFLDAFIINRPLLLSFISWYGSVNHFDLVADIFRENINRMKVYGYAFEGYAGVVSTLADYLQVNADFLSQDVRKQIFRADRPIQTKVQDNAPTKYGDNASVKNALIPTGCVISGTVEDSVLFRGVEIAEGAVVKNCVLMQHTKVGPGTVLENVVCDKNVVIRADTRITGAEGRPIAIPKNQEI